MCFGGLKEKKRKTWWKNWGHAHH